MSLVPRLIPACAGQIASISVHVSISKAHPRMRGADRKVYTTNGTKTGTSPHARGRSLFTALPCATEGLIPACAGQI